MATAILRPLARLPGGPARPGAATGLILARAAVVGNARPLPQTNHGIVHSIAALGVNRYITMALIWLLNLILGCFLDQSAILVLTVPVMVPVIVALGFDPIWFGVFVVLLVEIGAVTPPVGVNCFVVQATSEGRVELEDVFSGLIPYVLAGFVMLILLCLFPQLALFLPQPMP